MKKITLLLIIIFILTGCQKQNNEFKNESNISNKQETEQEIDSYQDKNPVKVALYKNSKKVTSYSTTLSNFKDIAVFDVYYTDIDTVDNNTTKSNYQKYYNEYQNIENNKNGFYISFKADGKIIEHLVLNPKSKHAMTPYLYVYLYDDINQEPNTYYSHLEPEDVNEKTIISSIKLFLAQEGSKITSPITLTAFTYDTEDDFTEDNKYRGNSSYTIEIDLKK